MSPSCTAEFRLRTWRQTTSRFAHERYLGKDGAVAPERRARQRRPDRAVVGRRRPRRLRFQFRLLLHQRRLQLLHRQRLGDGTVRRALSIRSHFRVSDDVRLGFHDTIDFDRLN